VRDEHIKEEKQQLFHQKKNMDVTNNTSTDNNSAASTAAENEHEHQTEHETEKEPKPRRLSEVPISEVLKAKHTLRWVEPIIDRNSTVRDAVKVCIERGLSAMMVVDTKGEDGGDDGDGHGHGYRYRGGSVSSQRGKVVGMATSRDLLRIIHSGLKHSEDNHNNNNNTTTTTTEKIFDLKVGDYMTPITQVIYARPEETIGMCRRIMAKLGVKCLPILSNGRVEGLVTSRDMSDYGLDASERGGKKHYLENRSERMGLSSRNTSMAEPPAYIRAHLALQKNPLFMNIGVAELPHPYKTPESCGMNRRDYGPDEVGDDCDLSEDAHFITRVSLSDETHPTAVNSADSADKDPNQNQNQGGGGNGNGNVCHLRDLRYIGVADGVGSWREYNVDPREFSHRLMQECSNILREGAAAKKAKVKTPSSDNDNNDDDDEKLLTPAELMGKAYERVKADNIIGSSTACIALFDGLRHQLHFSNLGDCGIIVLRHIDSDVAGALKRDTKTPRTERTSDLRVAFVSQQQLRSFNHPFQLGWTGEELEEDEAAESSFKSAAQCCTSSIHIRRGDIIIAATDGLYDNVELEDITRIALEWEQKNGFIVGGDIASREKRWRAGSSMTLQSAASIEDLARTLVEKARENSLDNSVDSPFAILAKENDIMWSGGMPDDCTIVAMHVVGAPAMGDEVNEAKEG